MNYEYSVPLSDSTNIVVKSNYIQNKLLPNKIITNNLIFKPIWNYDSKTIYDLYVRHDKKIQYMPVKRFENLKDVIDEKEKCRGKYNNNVSCKYIIEKKDSNQIIGVTGFVIDWDKNKSGYYIWLKEKYRGYEYSKERGIAFTSISFEILDLDSVKISVLTENSNSSKAIWKYIREFGGYPTGLQLNYKNITDSNEKDNIIEFTVTKQDYYNSLNNPSNKDTGINRLNTLISKL